MMRAFCLCAALSLAIAVPAADGGKSGIVETLSVERKRDAAVARALTWLRAQQKTDGAVGDRYQSGITGLALLAHFACGITLDEAEHGPWLRKSLGYALSLQDETGYFGGRDEGRMYGHGIITLVLAEALGQSKDDDLEDGIRRSLERALTVTISAAQIAKPEVSAGGWRYLPTDVSSDMSPTGWQMMSLHACRQVGMQIPDSVMSGAAGFAQRFTGADGSVGYDVPNADKPALRGVALLCLAAANRFDAPEVARISGKIRSDPIVWQGPWFFYRAYYDAVGLNLCAPDVWESYAPAWEAILLTHQNPEGTWQYPPGDNEATYGPIYTTCMAVLALAVQKHLLPAYQR
jgi:hypothetical protein